MKPSLAKCMLGGFLGTVVMTLMMYYVAPQMLGGPMDIAKMLGDMTGVSWTVGMVIHFFNGTVIFPAIYALLLYRLLPGAPWLKGAIWGFILWLIAELVVMPMAGAGVFHAAMGGMMAAMASLLGHLVYGAILGAVGDGPVP